MSEGITGGTTESASAPSEPSAPANIDQALDESFAASLTASAPDAPAEPAAEQGAAPTTEETPQEPDAPVASPEGEKGPIPFPVHKTALENARAKEREATLAQFQQEIAPYAPILKAIVQDEASGDIAHLDQILAQYAQDPVRGPKLRSYFGRMLAQQRGQAPSQPQAPVDDDPEPSMFVETEQGVMYDPNQHQKWREWQNRQVQKQTQAAIAAYDRLQQEKAAKQQQLAVMAKEMRESALKSSQELLSDMRSDEDFKEHETEVLRLMNENQNMSFHEAALAVYRKSIIPKKVAKQQQNWVSAAVKKSTGSTPDPAAAAAAQPRRPRSLDEALDQAFEGIVAS